MQARDLMRLQLVPLPVHPTLIFAMGFDVLPHHQQLPKSDSTELHTHALVSAMHVPSCVAREVPCTSHLAYRCFRNGASSRRRDVRAHVAQRPTELVAALLRVEADAPCDLAQHS